MIFNKIALLVFLSLTSFASDNRTPVSINVLPEDIDLARAQTWTPPDFSGQDGAIGYTPGAFEVPEALKPRVQFWTDVYTKYSSEQGLLHDSYHTQLVYEVVDFNDIMTNVSLNDAGKSKMKKNRIKQMKEEIKNRLILLSKVKDPSALTGDDLRYYELFKNIDEKNKFVEASQKGRLRFQLGQKDIFVKGIFYSGKYLREMEKIFREQQMPIELTRLPFVESSFNYKARSKVGASGIWQFMRSSGRLFRLKINSLLDERNDPIKATYAAAKLLRGNFNMLGNWPLAVTAYNHGPAGMHKLMKKYETSDIAEFVDVRKGRFGFASANFFASFLAALEAERNAERYFGVVYRQKPLDYKEIDLEKSIASKTILKWFDNNEDLAMEYNPHLSRYFWKGYQILTPKNYIMVPPEKYDNVMLDFQQIPKQTTVVAQVGEGMKYKIAAGDTLSNIATNFGVSIKHIIEANGIDDPRRLRVGQEIMIPGKE